MPTPASSPQRNMHVSASKPGAFSHWRILERRSIALLALLCLPIGAAQVFPRSTIHTPSTTVIRQSTSSEMRKRLSAPLRAETTADTLASSPCPMAHCDPQMSDDEHVVMNTSTVTITWAFSQTGVTSGAGLGCSAGITFTVCAGKNPTGSSAYDLPYVYALRAATGQLLWNSGHLLNGSVNWGAPLIDAGGNTYVADDNYIASFDAGGALRWRVPNPAQAAPTSLNMTADGYLVGQGRIGPVVVVDPATGRVTGSLLLQDTINGTSGIFATINTVTVLGNRVYTVTQFCPSTGCAQTFTTFSPGRLYAIDVIQGVPHVAWHWDFEGLSGASPLAVAGSPYPTIYFDGAGLAQGDPHHPWLFAVQDAGTTPILKWSVDFTASYGIPYYLGIQASPARDPRGGVWVWVTQDTRLFRLDEQTGAPLQTIDVSTLLGRAGFGPSSATSIALNAGKPIMLLGARLQATGTGPTFVLALDLNSGTLLWQLRGGTGTQGFPGQFPIVRTIAGPVIIAPRRDGTILGVQLRWPPAIARFLGAATT